MPATCVKCNQDGAIILIGTNGSFCQECFEKYFAHKFRASLGKNPVVRHGDKVAVAFSGGNNSSALLHVMLQSLSPTAFKRLKFHPGIIFVDETTLLPDESYRDKLPEVEEILIKSGLPYEIVKIEQGLKLGEFSSKSAECDDISSQLKTFFEKIKTVTSKEELLYRMRCKLLALKAKEIGYQHVFLGETSTRLAVNILSNIAQGRGGHMSLDTGFTDHGRYFGINLLRPLRDISAKEVAVYNALHKVPTVFFPTFSTKMPSNGSIQRLTEDFIVSLSAGFPATETTVFRTSNKLMMSKSSKKKEDTSHQETRNCYLCSGPLDNEERPDGASALLAIAFTEELSTGGLGTPDSPKLTKLTNNSPETRTSFHQSEENLNLCHCCRILRKDIPDDQTGFMFSKGFVLSKKVTEEEVRRQLDGILIDS